MRCLIFTGGDLIDAHWHQRQISRDDYLIAADRGAEHLLTLGYLPDIVIGDLDSISDIAKDYLTSQGVKFKISSSEKDQTDTELALIHALSLNPKEVLLFTALGNRLDHALANVFLLAGYLNWGVPIYFMTPTQTLWVTDKSIDIKGYPEQLVSLIALSNQVTDLTLTGFYYPLEKAVLSLGFSRGISNIMLKEEARIEFSQGILLIIVGGL